MSGEGECLYYYVQTELATIQREQEWLAEQEAKLESMREALLVRCGWVKNQEPNGRVARWSRGWLKGRLTAEALATVREAHMLLTGPESPAVKPDDSPGDLS